MPDKPETKHAQAVREMDDFFKDIKTKLKLKYSMPVGLFIAWVPHSATKVFHTNYIANTSTALTVAWLRELADAIEKGIHDE